MGTTIALTVNRCRTLWRGIQIAGSEISQKMKKHAKSRVVVPEAAGRWFAMRIISQLDVTSRSAHTNILNAGPYRSQHNKYARSSQTCLHAIPYAIMELRNSARTRTHRSTDHAIAARLKTHHKLPHIPKLARATTGKVIWKTAPGRAFRIRNADAIPNPSQTHNQACHQERPASIMEDAVSQLYADKSHIIER